MIQLNPVTAILLPTQLGLSNLHSMPALQPLKKTEIIHKIIHIPQTVHVYFMTKVSPQLKLNTFYIENTSWKVLAYGIYARAVDVSEIERVSAANE